MGIGEGGEIERVKRVVFVGRGCVVCVFWMARRLAGLLMAAGTGSSVVVDGTRKIDHLNG